MRINKAWHEAHRMPRNPTREQRVRWHAEHSRACGCRGVPGDLADDVRALGTGSSRGSGKAKAQA